MKMSLQTQLLPDNFSLVPTSYPSQSILVSSNPDSTISENHDDCFVLLKSKTGHILYRQAVSAKNFFESVYRAHDVLLDTIRLQEHIEKEISTEVSDRILVLRGMYFDQDEKDGFVYIDYFGPENDEVTNQDIFRLLSDSDDGYFKLPDDSDGQSMKIIIANHIVKEGEIKAHLLLSDSYYEPVYQKMNWKK